MEEYLAVRPAAAARSRPNNTLAANYSRTLGQTSIHFTAFRGLHGATTACRARDAVSELFT